MPLIHYGLELVQPLLKCTRGIFRVPFIIRGGFINMVKGLFSYQYPKPLGYSHTDTLNPGTLKSQDLPGDRKFKPWGEQVQTLKPGFINVGFGLQKGVVLEVNQPERNNKKGGRMRAKSELKALIPAQERNSACWLLETPV